MLSKLKLSIEPGEPLLVGVSGGADSVALLDALVQSGYRPHVCHLNHQWRGAESDADAEFVRELAGQYGLPVVVKSISDLVGGVCNPDQSRLKTAPTEEAGRQARLEFFESVAQQTGIHTLALAHTADDQVETFLLRLLRGAGPTGLIAMAAVRQMGSLRIVRPLLEVRRNEVIEHLKSRQLTWREDSSNADRQFLRNRVRHELLPLLETYNPGIREVLLNSVRILRDEDELLTRLAAALDTEDLWNQPVALQRRVLRRWLGEVDFDHIEAVRTMKPGNELSLPAGVTVCREGDALKIVEDENPVTGRWPLKLEGEIVVAELGVEFVVGEHGGTGLRACRADSAQAGTPVPPSRKEEHFDADSLGDAPFIRTWQDGDRFQPLGMTGEKKLQDFFVDEKVPRRQRGRVPLVCGTDGRIAWVVGYRIAEPFKVTERTRRVLRIEVRG